MYLKWENRFYRVYCVPVNNVRIHITRVYVAILPSAKPSSNENNAHQTWLSFDFIITRTNMNFYLSLGFDYESSPAGVDTEDM